MKIREYVFEESVFLYRHDIDFLSFEDEKAAKYKERNENY